MSEKQKENSFFFSFPNDSTLLKGTIKRRKYKININLFLFLSESTLFKGTIKRDFKLKLRP